MHPDFLPLLCCPHTGESLILEAAEVRGNGMVYSGRLATAGGRSYAIVRGVPRFVDQERYAGSFGYEWRRWPRVQFEAENEGGPMAGHTARMWQAVTEAGSGEVDGRTLVEFGCGSGRFLDIVRRRGGRAVGIDLSLAVESARANFADDPQVLIVQGDIHRPPFRAGAFDGGYTIGVLHHTPAPAQGLRALVRCVRPGGWVACCVYDRGGFYDSPSVALWRGVSNRLAPWFGYRPALAYAWFSARLLAPLARGLQGVPILRKLLAGVWRFGLVVIPLPDYRWRLLDTFDAITPAIASCHAPAEVAAWLAAADCVAIRRTSWAPTSFRAVRQAA